VSNPDLADATRRTRLANERTYLAWWRTGLTALAVALGAGKLVPELTDSSRWPYVVLGSGFGLLGVAVVIMGLRRFATVEDALDRGEYVRLGRREAVALAAAGAILGLLTVVLIIATT
jgi:putative membrane protein